LAAILPLRLRPVSAPLEWSTSLCAAPAGTVSLSEADERLVCFA
jgi:hypothetical protein